MPEPLIGGRRMEGWQHVVRRAVKKLTYHELRDQQRGIPPEQQLRFPILSDVEKWKPVTFPAITEAELFWAIAGRVVRKAPIRPLSLQNPSADP